MSEQDWLNVEFSGLQALLHDLYLGSDWLTNMAEAAKLKGIFIQYCMSNPRHAMQALQYPAVTQVSEQEVVGSIPGFGKYDFQGLMIDNRVHSFLNAVHCFGDGHVGSSQLNRKNIVQNTVKRNPRKAWIGALTTSI